MTKFEIIYFIIVSLIVSFSIYKVGDLGIKLRRLRRRYDLLLRGRGELNLEELLKAHSKDIDVSIRKIKALESHYDEISQKFEGDSLLIGEKVDSELKEINTKFSKAIEKEIEVISNSLQESKLDLANEMSKTKSTLKDNIDKLAKELRDSKKHYDNKFTASIKDLDEKYSSEILSINSSRQEKYKALDEKISFDIASLEKNINTNIEDLTKKLAHESKVANDKIALSLQHVAIHKYNAFDNQTGDLSFTVVLLDRFYNGIILTSLNGRDSSYTYAKAINSGRADSELSPEEEEALAKLIKK